MRITMIGIDCAVQARNVGLGRGIYVAGRTCIDRVTIAGNENSIAHTILDCIAGAGRLGDPERGRVYSPTTI